jgi:hypothetical protein
MLNRGLWFVLLGLLALALAGAFVISCTEDNVSLPDSDTGDLCAYCLEQNEGEGDDDASSDDDASDDDATDDDATDDDASDDDSWSADAGGPVLSDAAWTPSEISLGSGDASSTLGVYICDAENDLQSGDTWGDLYVWTAGTSEGFLSENPTSG